MSIPTISLINISKRFNREWIFKDINAVIEPGSKWMIGGGNGSGKSTLLQVIAGFISSEKGDISYSINNVQINKDNFTKYFTLASPYLQLIEEYTLSELINHLIHSGSFKSEFHLEKIIEKIGLTNIKNKPLNQYSSGMKQRVKLALAFFNEKPIILLDEPVSNLDESGIKWYRNLVEEFAVNKTIIVCSNNIQEEFYFCNNKLIISDFKS
ncbi:MAG: ATP-binding cassette domain-containing protein [Bacteroidia bacterium]